MKRSMFIAIMVIALTLASVAPALAKGSGSQGQGPPTMAPFSSAYFCMPSNLEHLPPDFDWLWGDSTLEVRNHATARIKSGYGAWNAMIVDYRMQYWDTSIDLNDFFTKHQVPEASANISCYYDWFYSDPGWITFIDLRLGEGQYMQWMDAHFPGWSY